MDEERIGDIGKANTQVGEVSRWMKSKKSKANSTIEKCNDKGEGAFEAIKEHWIEVWTSKAKDCTKLQEMLVQVPIERVKWRRPTCNVFEQTCGNVGAQGAPMDGAGKRWL